MLAITELAVMHLLQKDIVIYIVNKRQDVARRQEAMSESFYLMHVPAEKFCCRS